MTYLPKNLRHRFDPSYFFQSGGRKKRRGAAKAIERGETRPRTAEELLPVERTIPTDIIAPPGGFERIVIQPDPTLLDEIPLQGNNYSVVDYLNASGRGSSLQARRDLAATFGINNVGTAEGNLRLLRALQTQDGDRASAYIRPPKRVDIPPSARPQGRNVWEQAIYADDMRRIRENPNWRDARRNLTTVPTGPAVYIPQVSANQPSSQVSQQTNLSVENPYPVNSKNYKSWEGLLEDLKDEDPLKAPLWSPNAEVFNVFQRTFKNEIEKKIKMREAELKRRAKERAKKRGEFWEYVQYLMSNDSKVQPPESYRR